MKRTFCLVGPVLALGLGLPADAQAAGAEQAAAQWLGPGMDPALGRIAIDVTVSDATGHAVTGLTAKDFRLLDNGEPVKLVSFDALDGHGSVAEPPLSVILVIDGADVPRANFEQAQQDVETYLRRNVGRLAFATTVYRITSDGLFATSTSSDGNALAAQLGKRGRLRAVWPPPEPTPSQSLHPDFIDLPPSHQVQQSVPQEVGMPVAMRALGAITIEQRRSPGRKLLFWIGPGWRVDLSHSRGYFQTIVEFSTRLREARVEVSVAVPWQPPGESVPGQLPGESFDSNRLNMLDPDVLKDLLPGVRAERDEKWGNLALQVLALHSGGELLTMVNDFGRGAKEIATLIDRHMDQARHSYRLTYDPPPTGLVDEYRDLHVTVDRPGLVAHTTAGYYNEPVFYDDLTPYYHRVTIAQLEQLLKRGGGDRELAAELGGLEAVERVSSARLSGWLNRAPGQRTREALIVLADRSAFLEPPKDELEAKPAPNDTDQKAILQRAADYLVSEIPRLPNFYANRITTQYGEPVPGEGQTWKMAQADRRMRLERTTRARVFFEEHKEVVDHEAVKVSDSPIEEKLTTSGTFGPILLLAMKRASEPGSTLQWSRWEKSAAGPVAIFRFDVAPDLHGFGVGFCCLALDGSLTPYKQDASFRGEVAIDPTSGHILRLVVQARLEPRLPLQGSGIVVEYGPVSMGGAIYFCPVKSISMSRQRRLWETQEWGVSFRHYGPFKTMLNDVRFENYHLFRSESHMVPDYVPVQDKP
jgi:VWFA-related protein